MIAFFLSNICAKYYKNPSMLSRVIAKNVGDVFFETQCSCVGTSLSSLTLYTSVAMYIILQALWIREIVTTLQLHCVTFMQRCNCQISTGGQSISPQYWATGRARPEMPVPNGNQELFPLKFSANYMQNGKHFTEA